MPDSLVASGILQVLFHFVLDWSVYEYIHNISVSSSFRLVEHQHHYQMEVFLPQ